jgi:seryl-tRNA synthetase
MFIFCKAEDSDGFHKELVRNAEKLVEGLGLHYQTSLLAASDMSSAMAKTYDVEVFLPSLNDFKEVSSISNGKCYQPRRAMIRTKGAQGNEFVHALNASGLATSRLVPAIVEQFQNEDGSVNVPEVLHKYMHGIKVIKK